MKRNTILVGGLAVALLCAAIFLFIKQREAGSQAAKAQAADPNSSMVTKPTEALAVPEPLDVKTPPELGTTDVIVKTQKVAQVEKPKKPKPEKVVQDPLSRVALSLVGVDLDAEMYWFDAILDPSLPTSERQDLIDDLNEEGLPDPHHPTMDDLPLILRRIEILEALIPFLPEGFDWKEPLDDLYHLPDAAWNGDAVK